MVSGGLVHGWLAPGRNGMVEGPDRGVVPLVSSFNQDLPPNSTFTRTSSGNNPQMSNTP